MPDPVTRLHAALEGYYRIEHQADVRGEPQRLPDVDARWKVGDVTLQPRRRMLGSLKAT